MKPFVVSSHNIYRVSFEENTYIVKQTRLREDDLSPFWFALKELFGLSFQSQRNRVKELVCKLRGNLHIPPAAFVCADENLQYQVFAEVPGVKYEPDEFPDSDAVLYQLGLYIGSMHKEAYPCFGCYPGPKGVAYDFKGRLFHTMQQLIEKFWQGDAALLEYLEKLKAVEFNADAFHLMMADISANQFVFSEELDKINAVVDLDAYVIAPGEWELVVLELCMNRGEPFKKGYETYRPFPDLSLCRQVYRFLLYLCDPWEKTLLIDFMNQPVVF